MILFGYIIEKGGYFMQLDDEKIREVLSQNIKSARLSSGYTQESLAEMSDISLNFLKDVEGARSGTSLLTLINLCNSLNITPNELLKDFFKDSYDKTEYLTQQISLLNDYQKDTIYALIKHFKNTDMH